MADRKCSSLGGIAAQEERLARAEISKKVKDLVAGLRQVFGWPVSYAGSYRKENSKLKGEIGALKDDLDLAKKKGLNRTARNKIKDQIEFKEQNIKDNLQIINDEKSRLKEHNAIFNLLSKKFQEHMEETDYYQEPHKFIDGLKAYLRENHRHMTENWEDPAWMTSADLREIRRGLQRKYKVAKEIAQRLAGKRKRLWHRNNGKLGWWKDQINDPLWVMNASEKSFRAFDVIAKSRDKDDAVFSSIAPHTARLKPIIDKLSLDAQELGMFTADGITVEHMKDPLGRVRGNDIIESMENMIEYSSKIADGSVRKLIPIPTTGSKFGKKVVPNDKRFLKDLPQYAKIIDRNINSGMNGDWKTKIGGVGTEIQMYIHPVSKAVHFYVPIAQPAKGGERVWHAYEVPYEIIDQAAHSKDPMRGIKLVYFPETGSRRQLEKYKKALRKNRLATYEAEGVQILGSMEEGYYEADGWSSNIGHKKAKKDGEDYGDKYGERAVKGQMYDFNVYHWRDYIFKHNNPMPAAVNNYANALDDVFQAVAGDLMLAVKEIGDQKMATLKRIRKLLPKNEADNIEALVNSIDPINLNGFVKEDKDGNLEYVSRNALFQQLKNYFPHKKHIHDAQKELKLAKEAAEASLITHKEELEAEREKDKPNRKKIEKIKKKIFDLEGGLIPTADGEIEVQGQIDNLKETFTAMNDPSSYYEGSPLNAEQMIKASRHRRNFMSPLPTKNEKGEVKIGGIRRDVNVPFEYFHETYTKIEANRLLNTLIDALPGLHPTVQEYIVDHVKASLGHKDVQAGALGMDYSDQRVANIFEAVKKPFKRDPNNRPISPEEVATIGQRISSWWSGNLLQWGSNLTNLFQYLRVITEMGNVNNLYEAWRIGDSPLTPGGESISAQLANKAGYLDMNASLADHLMMGLTMDVGSMTGLAAMKDLAIIKLSKREFARKGALKPYWKKAFLHLYKNATGKNKPTTEELEQILKGYHEYHTGVMEMAKGKRKMFTEKEFNNIRKQMFNMIENDIYQRWATWGIKGGFIASPIKALGRHAEVFTFMGSEQTLRMQAGAAGAVTYVNSAGNRKILAEKYGFDRNDDRLYLTEEAQVAARIMVYQTMFRISPAGLSKAFRGLIGKIMGKFKQYTWNAIRTEWGYVNNYLDSLPQKNVWGAVKGLSDSVLSELLYGAPRYAWNKLFGKPARKGWADERMRMMARIQITNNLLFDWALKIPILTALSRAALSLVPRVAKQGYKYGAKTASLGIVISVAQWAWVMAVLTGAEDEEEREKATEQLMREGPFPLVNLWYLLSDGHPWQRSVGIFFKPAEWAIDTYRSMFKEDVRKRKKKRRKLR